MPFQASYEEILLNFSNSLTCDYLSLFCFTNSSSALFLKNNLNWNRSIRWKNLHHRLISKIDDSSLLSIKATNFCRLILLSITFTESDWNLETINLYLFLHYFFWYRLQPVPLLACNTKFKETIKSKGISSLISINCRASPYSSMTRGICPRSHQKSSTFS